MADGAGADGSSSVGWFESFTGGKSTVLIRSKDLEVKSSWSPWNKLFAVGGSIVTAYLLYKWYWTTDPDSSRDFSKSRSNTSESARHLRTYSSPRVLDSVLDCLETSDDSGEDEEEAKDIVYNADPNYIPNSVSDNNVSRVRTNDAQFRGIFNHLCSSTTSVNSSAHSQPGSDTVVYENQSSKSVTPNVAEMENQNEPPNGYVVKPIVNGKTSLESLRERFSTGNLPPALQVKAIENRNLPEASKLAAGGPLKKL